MTNPFTSHPHQVGETYREHFGFAVLFGMKMMLGGASAMVHAVFPFLFVSTASRISDELQAMRQNAPGRKKRLQAQQQIQQQ